MFGSLRKGRKQHCKNTCCCLLATFAEIYTRLRKNSSAPIIHPHLALPKFGQIPTHAGRIWSQLWLRSAKIGRSRPKLDQVWPNSARIWSKSARITKSGKNGPKYGETWPTRALIWPKSFNLCRSGPSIGLALAELDHIGLNAAEVGPKLVRIGAGLAESGSLLSDTVSHSDGAGADFAARAKCGRHHANGQCSASYAPSGFRQDYCATQCMHVCVCYPDVSRLLAGVGAQRALHKLLCSQP